MPCCCSTKPSAPFQAGQPTRPCASAGTVILLEAEDKHQEAREVIDYLHSWQQAGYDWGDMALLFRTSKEVGVSILSACNTQLHRTVRQHGGWGGSGTECHLGQSVKAYMHSG